MWCPWLTRAEKECNLEWGIQLSDSASVPWNISTCEQFRRLTLVKSQVGHLESPCDGEIYLTGSSYLRSQDPHRTLRRTRQWLWGDFVAKKAKGLLHSNNLPRLTSRGALGQIRPRISGRIKLRCNEIEKEIISFHIVGRPYTMFVNAIPKHLHSSINPPDASYRLLQRIRILQVE